MALILASWISDSEIAIGFGSLFHWLASFGVIFHILRRPRDARTALLWIFFVSFFPFFGLIAYILFGINTIPKKGGAKHYSDVIFAKREKKERRHDLARTYQTLKTFQVQPEETPDPSFNRLLDTIAPEHHLLNGNHLTLYPSAEESLQKMFEAMKKAKHHIHLTTYILADDEIGRRLLNIVAERAKAGVQIRILYDAFGSAHAELRGFFRRYRKIPHLELVPFSQSNIFKRQFQLNLRSHRKLVIIDGTSGFLGGVNFHDVYLPKPNGEPGVIDYHFHVSGPVVLEMQYSFLRDWFYITDEPPEHFFNNDYYPLPQKAGSTPLRVIDSSPMQDQATAMLQLYVAAINRASEQILLLTPYFVPTEALLIALCQAAQRGVDVKIIVPGANNHPTIHLASRAQYQQLLNAGVRIFERNPPFIHAKAAVFDNHFSIVGSSNLDPRSLVLNYETNLQIESSDKTQQIKAAILADLNASIEITLSAWKRRSNRIRMLENFFNLFHPIA